MDTSLEKYMEQYRSSQNSKPMTAYASSLIYQANEFRNSFYESHGAGNPPVKETIMIPAKDDQLTLRQCFHLHAFLEKKVVDHLLEKLWKDLEEKSALDDVWEDHAFDMQIMKRAFALLRRFYREKGFRFSKV